ncbi:2515_t:CDS:2, partial [Rhizophagus irregularis]
EKFNFIVPKNVKYDGKDQDGDWISWKRDDADDVDFNKILKSMMKIIKHT